MAPAGSVDSGEGSTISSPKKRVVASIHWCFTLNNWNEDQLNILLGHDSDGSIKKYVWQEEVGTNGTPHLQGYIEFAKKQRPVEFIGIKQIHWEKCRDVKASIAYCTKDDTATGKRWTNIRLPKPIKIIKEESFYHWEKEIIEMISEEPDDRTIHWYWEPDGGVGKTAFCKYLVVKHHAVILSGKGNDCKYGIVKYHEENGVYPELIIYDVPRCNLNYISYDALESIKNGLFFSGKYESGQVVMNCPHLLVFANEEPEYEKMSRDRWRVSRIRVIKV